MIVLIALALISSVAYGLAWLFEGRRTREGVLCITWAATALILTWV